jgi:microcystin-dependent protein
MQATAPRPASFEARLRRTPQDEVDKRTRTNSNQSRAHAGLAGGGVRTAEKMSQGSTVLPTIGVFSGLTEQGSINAALAALLSNNSGGAAPSAPAQYQFWADTSVSNQVTIRMYIGTTWVPLMVADTSTGAIIDDPLSPKNWVTASGTHDAITATYDPPVTTLVDGMVLSFRATSANQTAAPTFNPNGLGALTITKLGGAAMWGADIPGNLAECQVRYNAANTRWELISPVFSVPVCGIVPWFGGSVPSSFALPQGQNLSSTAFPIAAAVLGITYGNPGGGNFTMPDLRGRYPYNLDSGGSGRITLAGGNWDGTVLGNTGGSQNRALSSTSQLPQFTPSGSISGTATATYSAGTATLGNVGSGGAFNLSPGSNYENVSAFVNGSAFTFTGNSVGSASPATFPTLPPSMGLNFMMRIA